jgi:Cu2+-containing amine oxidase
MIRAPVASWWCGRRRCAPRQRGEGGKRDYDWSVQRGWKIVNNNIQNGLGTSVGYKLVPSGAFPPR